MSKRRIRTLRISKHLFLLLTLWLSYALTAAAQDEPLPIVVDVFAATPKSTSGNPQSALVILEGSDADTLADALTYRIVTSPANGNLSDPDNGGAAVST
ncbi:MAG: hypothetical protein AB8B57_11480, partial [Congregibacter sp.]